MYLGSKLAALLLLASCAGAATLRVCADPDNLPYSNVRGQGFENELARLVAQKTGQSLSYYWISQRGHYFQLLEAGLCDAVMEAPAGLAAIRTTRPYYRSSYVFVSRRGNSPAIRSFNDPRLKTLRIGIQVLSADDAAVPPAQALARRGLIQNIRWYRTYQQYLAANRPELLVEAVAHGDVDVAIAWGPLAGYFAKNARAPLEVIPVSPQIDGRTPFAFDIAMGVRRNDTRRAAQLNSILAANGTAIRRILARYGVPLVEKSGGEIMP